jgi:hypothetical protein
MNKSVKIEIGDKVHVIQFPTVGQLFQIESLKILYSNSTYGDLARSQTKQASYALDLIDALSTFMVLIPDFGKLIGSKGVDSLTQEEAIVFVKAYKKDYLPFFKEINDGVQELIKEL